MKQLKNVLRINAFSSGATGAGLVVFAKAIAALFGISSTVPFVETGLFLVVFAVFVFIVSSKKEVSRPAVKIVTALDIVWVIASGVLLLTMNDAISVLGNIIIAAVAMWVALMAFLQNRFLKTVQPVLSKAAVLAMTGMLLLNGSMQAQSNEATSSNEAVTVVNNFLEAVKEKSHAKAAPLLDSLIEWDQPGNNRFSGLKKNAKEVFGMFRGFIESTNKSLHLQQVQVLAVNDNTVACLLKWTATNASGKSLNVDNIDAYTVENGKIKKAVVYSADVQQEDGFWGK